MCKVQWNRHSMDEATWEREEDLRTDYPISLNHLNLEDEIHLKGGRFVTPKIFTTN